MNTSTYTLTNNEEYMEVEKWMSFFEQGGFPTPLPSDIVMYSSRLWVPFMAPETSLLSPRSFFGIVWPPWPVL